MIKPAYIRCTVSISTSCGSNMNDNMFVKTMIHSSAFTHVLLSYHGEIDSALDKAKSKAADFLDR